MLKLRVNNPGNRLDRLSLREYHFGKTTAAMAIEINLGRSHVGDARISNSGYEVGHRKLSGDQAGGRLFQQVSIHAFIIGRRKELASRGRKDEK
jgi:hypothetical protein